MTVKLLITVGMLLAFASLLSGKDKIKLFYPVAAIDSSLKKDAWAVCRDYQKEFVILNYGKAIERVHIVITILEKRGDDLGSLVLFYDKSTKINSISGKSYNMLGIPDEKLKNDAIQDLNYTSEGAVYDDLRMKKASFSGNIYPCTVEYNYEIEHNGLINYPEWKPMDDYRLSVEKTSFQISYPDSIAIRFREFHLPAGCRTEKHENGLHSIEWKLDSLKAWREEPYSPELYLETPHVITAPTKFIYEGYSGSMNTWKDYSQWQSKLNEGRDQLSPQRQNEILELVKGIKDTTQIIRKLYGYMQNRTRYVGIQLGIGGLQPFPAETVDRLGYGDCKALSNYMKALLKAVGIPSLYTVAGAADNQGITMVDFPSNAQSNHIILCVPLRRDTIWLECTSQRAPFGYLSTSTAGRKALNITSEGGNVVSTPLLTASQNSQECKAEVQVNPDGSIQATVKTKYSGYQYDNISENLIESKKEQEKALYSNLSIAGMVISDFSYEVKKDRIPQAVETINLMAPAFASKTGSRLFIPLNIFNQIKTIPARIENRKMPVYRDYAYIDKDSVTFHLPKGFNAESTPRGKTLTSEFGEYSCSITLKDDMVTYIREMKMNRGTWPKERYSALVDFYSAIVSADKVKLVMKEEVK
ncbi:MAG: DUF3857 domain-containing protein [Bacteroidia bacterium]|nr:DUF3857 domain-containing protein [Bacteroidia bacterium]